MRPIILFFLLTSCCFLACNNFSNEKEKNQSGQEVGLSKKEIDLKENESNQQKLNPINPDSISSIKKGLSVDKAFLIRNGSVNIFKIGNPIPFPNSSESYKITKESRVRMTEEGPFEETIFVVSEKGEELLNIGLEYLPEDDDYSTKIGEIIIQSDKYKTSKGISVNSTIEEFIEKYPKNKFWYTYISGMYVIETDELNAQFILNEKDFIGKLDVTSEITKLKSSDFKPNSKIMKIRLF